MPTIVQSSFQELSQNTSHKLVCSCCSFSALKIVFTTACTKSTLRAQQFPAQAKSWVYIPKCYFAFLHCKKFPRYFTTASLVCVDCVSPGSWHTELPKVSQYYAETLVCCWTEGRVPNTEPPVLLSLAPGIFFGKFPTNYYAGQNLLALWDLTRSQPEEIQKVRHSHHSIHRQISYFLFRFASRKTEYLMYIYMLSKPEFRTR